MACVDGVTVHKGLNTTTLKTELREKFPLAVRNGKRLQVKNVTNLVAKGVYKIGLDSLTGDQAVYSAESCVETLRAQPARTSKESQPKRLVHKAGQIQSRRATGTNVIKAWNKAAAMERNDVA